MKSEGELRSQKRWYVFHDRTSGVMNIHYTNAMYAHDWIQRRLYTTVQGEFNNESDAIECLNQIKQEGPR